MAEIDKGAALLKRAANFFFKSLGNILNDAINEARAIEKEGKLGQRVKMHTDSGEGNDPRYTDVVVDMWIIKGKDKYYVDRMDFYEHGTDREIGFTTEFKPRVIDSDDESLINLIEDRANESTNAWGRPLGRVMTDRDKFEDESDSDESQDNEESQSESPDNGINPEVQPTPASKQLKVTLSRINSSTELAATNISCNYSAVYAASDLISLVDAPAVAEMMGDKDEISICITDDGEDYDITECEQCQPSPLQMYQMAFDAILSIRAAAEIKGWMSVESCNKWYWTVDTLNIVLKGLAHKILHICPEAQLSCGTYCDLDLASEVDAIDKATDALYMLSADLDDPTVFDDYIAQLEQTKSGMAESDISHISPCC